MEQQAKKAPLPCFGQEHDRFDPRCQKCPHFDDCLAHMGSRADKIPLNRVKFDVVPDAFRQDAFEMDDPELPQLQRIYADCFHSVFHRNPTDNISLYKDVVATNARKASCSVRMFMLANMVAHEVHEAEVIKHREKARSATFRAKLLTGDLSIKRAEMYQQMCSDRYGTFSLSSLVVLTDSEDKPELETIMLHSEVTAALWVVRYKIFNGGAAEAMLYESTELQLAPEWLALEQSYFDLILKPYAEHKLRSTEAIERHRFNVFQTHTYYKRHLTHQRNAWLTRQHILPAVVQKVVNAFGLHADDFLYPREPVKNAMNFWKAFALTVRHYHCWLYLNDEPSYFTPRRNETPRRS